MPRYIDADWLLGTERLLDTDVLRRSKTASVVYDQMMFDIENTPTADVVPTDDDFGTILICAVRYSIGRQTYMPSLVIDYITPLLPSLNDKCLAVMERDVAEAGYYGHEVIDKPGWMKFLGDVRSEMAKRGK